MGLPHIPMPVETVTVGGVAVTVHGLSVEQMRKLQVMAEEDTEAAGTQALAWATDTSLDEVIAWIERTSPQFGLELAEHVMRLSGMTPSVAARFPAGVHAGDRGDGPVRSGRQDAPPATGDP